MSQTRIKTYKDLCEERERIKNLLVVQRQKVKDDWDGLKDEFIPVKNAFGVVSKFTSADKSNPLINMGLKLAGDVFLKSFVLGKAGWLTRMAVPFVVKNYSSHFLVEKGKPLVNRVMNLFKTRKKPYYSKGYSATTNFSAMDDKDNKVVNTEEQNRTVNPGTGDYQETSPKEHVGTNQAFSSDGVDNDKRNKPEKTTRAED